MKQYFNTDSELADYNNMRADDEGMPTENILGDDGFIPLHISEQSQQPGICSLQAQIANYPGPVYNNELVNGLQHLLDQANKVNIRRLETLDGNPEALRVAALALQVEIAELLQELNWKPWKQERPVDLLAAADELADVLIFTANLVANVMGQTGLTLVDIAAAHASKTLINIERASGRVDGYGKE